MICLRDGRQLVQDLNELPDFSKCSEVFLDIESRNYIAEKIVADMKERGTSITDEESKLLKHGGLYPHGGDRICGIAVTADDHSDAYYIPIRHINEGLFHNLPIEPVMDWVRSLLSTCKLWINHNVNFDAQFFHVDGVEFDCQLACTTCLSKILDSDRFEHGLKDLCADILKYDISAATRVSNYLKELFSAEHWHNYAAVPIDILGEYACDDVLMNRELYRHFMKELPEEQYSLWETEKNLTAILYDMEVEGLAVNHKECQIESFKALHNMINQGTIIRELSGLEFTNSAKCISDILQNQFNMPIVVTKKVKEEGGKWVDTGRVTFDKEALALYEIHPMALQNKDLRDVISAIKSFRTDMQFKSLYPDTFLVLSNLIGDDWIVHPAYNQIVRTGRMSCKRPNSQQQNYRSKSLIHPHIGFGFISCDYSQIEFRLIAHYIKDMDLINAYNNDATTDFHQWVADLMHVTRKVGKTLNFGMAYGAGKRAVVRDLTSNPDIIEEMSKIVVQLLAESKIKEIEREAVFARLCKDHAETAYNEYHVKIPGLRDTSNRAGSSCKYRGYIFNAYGRRRHLPQKACYKAFNSLIQSCAMDLMKERMVALSPRYNKQMRDWGIRIAANVHDEILFECPLELLYSKEVHDYIINMLESPSIEFRIPMQTGLGLSPNNWAEAAGEAVITDDNGDFVAGCLVA